MQWRPDLSEISTPGPARGHSCLLFSGDWVYLASFLGCVSYHKWPLEKRTALIIDRAAQTPPHPLPPQPPAQTKSHLSPAPTPRPLWAPESSSSAPPVTQPWEGAEHPTGSPGSDSQLVPKQEAGAWDTCHLLLEPCQAGPALESAAQNLRVCLAEPWSPDRS